MNWVNRLLANQTLVLANRLAPVFSCAILTCYALSGKRLSIVLGGNEPDTQKTLVSSFRMTPREYFFHWNGK